MVVRARVVETGAERLDGEERDLEAKAKEKDLARAKAKERVTESMGVEKERAFMEWRVLTTVGQGREKHGDQGRDPGQG